MPDTALPSDPPDPRPARPPRRGILAGLRIRKKLIVLHTSFSLVLAVLLLVALRPALTKVIVQGEQAQASVALDLMRADDQIRTITPPAALIRCDHQLAFVAVWPTAPAGYQNESTRCPYPPTAAGMRPGNC
jgi:hypothetical protein